MLRYTLLILAFLLLLAAPAAAGTADTDVSIAEAHWGRTPMCGKAAVVSSSTPPVAEWIGWAQIGGTDCTIYLNTANYPQGTDSPGLEARACSTVVHEYGHLLGLQHSTDPSDVMYPALLRLVPACEAAYAPAPAPAAPRSAPTVSDGCKRALRKRARINRRRARRGLHVRWHYVPRKCRAYVLK